MGTNCLTVPPSRRLVILFVGGIFLTGVSKKNEKKLPYIDGVLSLNECCYIKWRVHNVEIKMVSFVVKFRFNWASLPISSCRSRYEEDLAVSVVSFISSSM
jgi:hypothetical protein